MLKKIVFISSMLTTCLMAKANSDDFLKKTQEYQQKIEHAIGQLREAADRVALDQDQEKLLHDALLGDSAACVQLLAVLEHKFAHDKKIIHEAVNNADAISHARWDAQHFPERADGELAKVVAKRQKRIAYFLEKLNEIMPGEYTLWKYYCPKSETEIRKEIESAIYALAYDTPPYEYESDRIYVLVVTDNNKKSIEVREYQIHLHRDNSMIQIAEQCSEEVSKFATPSKLKEMSKDKCSDTFCSWHRIFHSKEGVSHGSEIKTIVANTGKLSDVLHWAHEQPMQNLIERLKRVIALLAPSE